MICCCAGAPFGPRHSNNRMKRHRKLKPLQDNQWEFQATTLDKRKLCGGERIQNVWGDCARNMRSRAIQVAFHAVKYIMDLIQLLGSELISRLHRRPHWAFHRPRNPNRSFFTPKYLSIIIRSINLLESWNQPSVCSTLQKLLLTYCSNWWSWTSTLSP